MPVTEYERNHLFAWFEEHMGKERAATMMSMLPPVGWADVATKRDLDVMPSSGSTPNRSRRRAEICLAITAQMASKDDLRAPPTDLRHVAAHRSGHRRRRRRAAARRSALTLSPTPIGGWRQAAGCSPRP